MLQAAWLGDSPALQVAEVQQVELPAVLAVVNVVHILPRRMNTWMSSALLGRAQVPGVLEAAEHLGHLFWGVPCLNPKPKTFPNALAGRGHVQLDGTDW